jgi:hypothetical protein
MSRKEMDPKATDQQNGEMLWSLSEDLLSRQGVVFQKSFPSRM